ncbi:MAG: alanine/ornithine racemase family PLP-dependent enzyme [Peptococcaceae bacterium]|nr:alanine/ornithine racemase family PLP-dependent enzyme [Peptococcaceae bacterium]
MVYPHILLDSNKLTHNTRVICAQAAKYGIKIAGVTKACLANPAVAKAMAAGGVCELADSRIENLARLKDLQLNIPLLLLRSPGLSQIKDTIELADTSLNSQYEVMAQLAAEARRQGKIHQVIVMVDLGDLREGVLPKEVVPMAKELVLTRGLKLRGIGANFACYGGVRPSVANLGELITLARELEAAINQKIEVVSGGNSSSLELLFQAKIPVGVTHLRIGEGILLGRETIQRKALPRMHQDAFSLRAEVVEVQVKTSVPKGEIGQDAFGCRPSFSDTGPMLRAIVAIGRQDVPLDGIFPLEADLRVIGASSDHLIIDAAKKPGIRVGDTIHFGLNYAGLLGAMTSPFVSKRVKDW